MTNYEKDIAICGAASDGPWEFGFYNVCSKEEAMELAGLAYEATKNSVGVRSNGYGAFIHGTDVKISDCGYSDDKSEDNARYITHFNPSYVRELIEARKERDELKAKVNDLREAVEWARDSEWGRVDRIYAKTPAQSLADHDIRVAEKVREACACSIGSDNPVGGWLSDLIRNIDLSEVIKDE